MKEDECGKDEVKAFFVKGLAFFLFGVVRMICRPFFGGGESEIDELAGGVTGMTFSEGAGEGRRLVERVEFIFGEEGLPRGGGLVLKGYKEQRLWGDPFRG